MLQYVGGIMWVLVVVGGWGGFGVIGSVGVEWLEFEWRYRVTQSSSSSQLPKIPSHFTASWGGSGVNASIGSWSGWANWTSENAAHFAHNYPNTELDWDLLVTYWEVEGESAMIGDFDVDLAVQSASWSGQRSFQATVMHATVGEGFFNRSSRLVCVIVGPAPPKSGGVAPIVTGAFWNNRQYWSLLSTLAPATVPSLFPLIDVYRQYDDDVLGWEQGVRGMAQMGTSALGTSSPSSARVKALMRQSNITQTAGAVAECPLGFNDYSANASIEKVRADLDLWAAKVANPFLQGGFAKGQVASFAIADEPSFYLPGTLQEANRNAYAIQRYHTFLQSHNVTPNDLGKEDWESVALQGRGGVVGIGKEGGGGEEGGGERKVVPHTSLLSHTSLSPLLSLSPHSSLSTASSSSGLVLRRNYYWSARFLAWDSARFLSEVGASVVRQLGSDATSCCVRCAGGENFTDRCPLTQANMNNFQARLFTPGPIGHNPDPSSNSSGAGSLDWLSVAAAQASSPTPFAAAERILAPHTEDWFEDRQSWEWMMRAARLQAGAKKGDTGFGGYVVPRKSVGSPFLQHRAIALVARGATFLSFYTFGPEYLFPLNTFSEQAPARFPALIRTANIISFVEHEILSTQHPPTTTTPTARRGKVALIFGRSARLWDEWGEAQPTIVHGGATPDELSYTSGWCADALGLFTVANWYGIDVDIVDEDDLLFQPHNHSPQHHPLEGYDGVMLTSNATTNVSAIASFVKEMGKTAILVGNAGVADSFNTPLTSPLLSLLTSSSPPTSIPPFTFKEVAIFNSLQTPLYNQSTQIGTALGPLSTFHTLPKHATILANASINTSSSTTNPTPTPSIVSFPSGNGQVLWFGFRAGLSAIATARGVGVDETLDVVGKAMQSVLTPSTLVGYGPVENPPTSTIPGVEVRVIDNFPISSTIFVTNWTSYAPFPASETQPIFTITTPIPQNTSTPTNVTSLDVDGAIPFHILNNGTAIQLSLPSTDNVTAAIISYTSTNA